MHGRYLMQVETHITCLNRKGYPRVFWRSLGMPAKFQYQSLKHHGGHALFSAVMAFKASIKQIICCQMRFSQRLEVLPVGRDQHSHIIHAIEENAQIAVTAT